MKRWLIMTKDKTGRPAKEGGEAPQTKRLLSSGTKRAQLLHRENIHQHLNQFDKI